MKNLHIFSLVLTIVVIFVFVNTNIKEKMTTAPNYVNIGCWYDKPIHAIPLLYSTSVTSIEHAKQIATANNATVFGIQYGGQLFLGNDINAAKQYGPVGNNACQTSLNAWSSLQNDVWVLDSSIAPTTQNASTNAPTNAPTNTPTSMSTNAPTNAPTNTPTSMSTNTPTSMPTNTSTSMSTNTPTSMSTNTPTSISANTPTSMSSSMSTTTLTSEPTKSTNNSPNLISKILQYPLILLLIALGIGGGIYYYLAIYKKKLPQQLSQNNFN
jgi:hypothetical protein